MSNCIDCGLDCNKVFWDNSASCCHCALIPLENRCKKCCERRLIIETTRTKILNIIPFDEGICVSDINANVPISIRTVHKHLRQLTEEGLIKKTKSVKDMRKVFYKRIK